MLKLSPNVRLRMTVEREMLLDKSSEIFTEEMRSKYIEMHNHATSRQDSLLKSVVVLDSVLFFLVFGKNFKLPGTDIGIQDIPAALVVVSLLAAFSFLMLCLAFLNSQLYLAICEQFSIKEAKEKGIDPDFVTASRIYTELYLKTFRKKLNMFGEDFFIARCGYGLFYGTMTALISIVALMFIAMHFVIVGVGAWSSFPSYYAAIPFSFTTLLINLIGLASTFSWSFDFDIPSQVEIPASSNSPPETSG